MKFEHSPNLYRKIIIFALFSITLGSILLIYRSWQCQGYIIRMGRARDAQAGVVARQLLAFQLKNGGRNPKSLAELGLWPGEVDISEFRLLPPGTRSGHRNRDVIIEAPGYYLEHSGLHLCFVHQDRMTIRIYQDCQLGFELDLPH